MERSLDHDPSRTVRPDAPAEQPSGAGKPADQGCRVSERASTVPAGSAGDPSVTYMPRPGTTPEGELAALAAVYGFVIECHKRSKATRSKHDSNATRNERRDLTGKVRPTREDGGRHANTPETR